MSEDRDQKVAAIVKRLETTTVKEHLATITKAAIGAIPYVGGTISTLLEDLIPNWKLQRLDRFVAELSVDLENLGNKIKTDYLKTEEFGFLLEKTFRAVFEEYEAEKLRALRGILVNSMIRTDVDQQLKEYFLNLATRLGGLHMRLLSILRDPKSYYEQNGIQGSGGSVIAELRVCFQGLSDGNLRALWNDIYNYGLTNTDSNGIAMMISTSGYNSLERRLTDFGKQFVEFVTLS